MQKFNYFKNIVNWLLIKKKIISFICLCSMVEFVLPSSIYDIMMMAIVLKQFQSEISIRHKIFCCCCCFSNERNFREIFFSPKIEAQKKQKKRKKKEQSKVFEKKKNNILFTSLNFSMIER